MQVNDSCPFILMEGSRLVIPEGIKSRFLFDGNTDIEIPLTAVEIRSDVYHFIPADADESEDMVIWLSAGVIMPAMAIVIERIDFFQKRAWAKLA